MSRANPDLKREQPTTVLLCRHGETDWNLQKRFQGLEDVPLNDVGRRQARQMASVLKGMNVAAVYASPLRRAKDTGAVIADISGITLRIDGRLIERDLGRMQRLTSAEVRNLYPKFWDAWKNTGVPFPPEAGVENGPDAVLRMESALFDLARAYPGKTVAVVSHGALIRVLLHRAVGTASISTLVVGPGQSYRLAALNDVGHLKGFTGPGSSVMPGTGAEGTNVRAKPTTVLVCRHGETEWNRTRRFQGSTDVSLNERGCEQALVLAEALRTQGLYAVWASPLHRARETGVAVAAASGLQLHLEDRLRARSLGIMEGKYHTEVEREYPAVWTAWQKQLPLPEEAGAESNEDVVSRVEAALFDLAAAYPGKRVAVIFHAEILRSLLKRVVGQTFIETPDNASFTELSVQGAGRTWHILQSGTISADDGEVSTAHIAKL